MLTDTNRLPFPLTFFFALQSVQLLCVALCLYLSIVNGVKKPNGKSDNNLRNTEPEKITTLDAHTSYNCSYYVTEATASVF